MTIYNPLNNVVVGLDDALDADMSDGAEFTIFETNSLDPDVDKLSIRVTVWSSPGRHYNFCYVETEDDDDTTIENALHPLDLVQFLPESAQGQATEHIVAWLNMLGDAVPMSR